MMNMIIEIKAYLGNINGRPEPGRCLIAPAAIVAIMESDVTVIENGKTPTKRPSSLVYLAGVNDPIHAVLPLNELAMYIQEAVRQTNAMARASQPAILVPAPGR